MSDILILAEYQNGKIKKTTFELLSKAVELSGQTGGKVAALLIGCGLESLASELSPYGAKQVILADHPDLEKYNSLAYSACLAKVIVELNPSVVLATASPVGKDLLPRVAARLKAGLATDAVDLKIEGGKLVAKKPLYSGKVFADVVFNSPLQMATTRPNSFPIKTPQSGNQAEIKKIAPETGVFRAPLKEVCQGEAQKADLTEAEIIVSGGRAMGNAENFNILKELADVLGASVGASRAAVDSGYATHDMQVGQTGKVVNPKLYFACGISGAIQHLAGMRTSKVIVAINKDPEAPLFQRADYGLVGDLFTLVPLVTQEFKKLLSD